MKTKRILSIAIIVGFIITFITIQINREIKKENMYQAEIKGVVWDIFLMRGGNHYYYNINDEGDYFVDEHFFYDKPSNIIKKNDSVYKAPNSEKPHERHWRHRCRFFRNQNFGANLPVSEYSVPKWKLVHNRKSLYYNLFYIH